jgi:succinoglycan biosynthesis transport protein ExoP
MHRINYSTDEAAGHDVVFDVWHRRKWVAVVTFAAAAAAAVTIARSLPNIYRASATVLVEQPQVSEAFVRTSVTTALETRIQTIHQRVMSRDRLADVIARLNLYPELQGRAPISGIVSRMRRDIQPLEFRGVEQTSARTGTIAFSLGYTGRDPETVARVVNTLAELYIEENTKSRGRQAARTAEFLGEQLEAAKQELDTLESRTSQFRVNHGSELPEQMAVNLATLERLNAKLRLNGDYQSRVMERRDRLEREIAQTRSTGSPAVSTITPEEATLAKLKQELADLRRQYSDRYPDVIRLQSELARFEEQLAQRGEQVGQADGETAVAGTTGPVTTGDSPTPKQALSQVEAELDSLKKEESFLRQLILGYEGRLENAPKRDQELRQLSSGYDTTKERYQSLLKRYEDAQLAENLEEGQNVEQFRVLDAAIPPSGPAAPDRLRLLLMGLMAALGLAFGAVLAAEKLDTTFHTVDDLRAFVRAPTLATIRAIRTPGDARRRRLRVALVAAAILVAVALIVAGADYIATGNEQIVRRLASF